MSLEKLNDHESRIKDLEKVIESINTEKEIKRIIEDQNKKISPYLGEAMKYLTAIILVLLLKDKALQFQWIANLMKW